MVFSRKDAKAQRKTAKKNLELCVFATLREKPLLAPAAHDIKFKLDIVVDAHHAVKC